MGTPLATAWIRLRPDSSGFRQEAEKSITGDLDKVGTIAGGRLAASLSKALDKALDGTAIGQKIGDEFAKGFNDRVKDQTKDAPVGPDRPRTRKQGQDSGGSFADGFRQKLEQASKALPPLNIGVAKDAAEQQIRDLQTKLRDLSGKTIGVDLDAGAAIAQVRGLENELRGLATASPNIQVRADAAAALARLAQVTAEADKLDRKDVKVNVDVDTDRATRGVAKLTEGLVGQLGGVFSKLTSAGEAFFGALGEGGTKAGLQIGASMASAGAEVGGMTLATGGLNLVIGAAVAAMLAESAAIATVVSGFLALAPVVSVAGGLLGGFTTLLVGGGAAVGVLLLGLGGLGEALSAMSAAQNDATKSSASFTSAQNAVRNASDQVRSALASESNTRVNVAEAARRAAQQVTDAQLRVKDAQRLLTDAERDALQVRRDLTGAQTEAKRNLEDLASAVKSNGLDQRQAVLDVTDAQKALQKVLKDPKATAEQRAQAQLSYERQVQQLDDLRVRGKRLAAEQADATKKGVNGSDQVVAARRRVADADRKVGDTQRGVSQALAGVSEARRAQQAQERQGAYQLAQAHQAVVGAQRALAQASTQAGQAGGSALAKLNQQMAQLSPNAQKVVRTLSGLKGPFDELRKFVQDRLLDGVAGQIKDLAGKWLPSLHAMLGGLADRFNAVGDGLFKAFGRKDFIDNLKVAVAGFGDMIDRIGKSTPGFIDAFGRLAKASAPVLRTIGDLIGGIFDKFSKWIRSADQTGALDSFMKDAAATLHQIFDIGGLVIGIVGQVIQTFFPQSKQASDSFLGGVQNVLRNILGWLSDPKNQQRIREWVGAIVGFVTQVVTVWIPQVAAWVTRISGWVDTVSGWVDRVKGWGQILAASFAPIKLAWGAVELAVGIAWRGIAITFGLMKIGLSLLGAAFTALYRNTIGPVFNGIYNSVIKPVWDKIKPILSAVGDYLGSHVAPAFKAGVDTIGRFWSGMVDVAKKPVEFVVKTVINSGIIDTFNRVAAVFPGVSGVSHVPWPPKGWATGGVLPGYTPGRDVHRFYSATGGMLDLSGGEAVMRPEVTQAVGKGWVDRLNGAARTGGVGGVRQALSGAFAAGGVLGRSTPAGDGLGDLWNSVKKKATDVIEGAKSVLTDPIGAVKGVANKLISLIPGQDQPFGQLAAGVPRKLLGISVGQLQSAGVGQALATAAGATGPGNGKSPFGGSAGMMRILHAQFPGLRLISGFRPGAVTLSGNQSYHSVDRAVDVPPIEAVAKWIHDKLRSVTKELITPWQQYNLWNGKPHTYTGAVWNQHNFAGGNAHDHWAARLGGVLPKFPVMDSGGWLMPGWNPPIYNGTGRPEPVVPGEQIAEMVSQLRELVDAVERGNTATRGVGGDVATALHSSTRRAVQIGRGTTLAR